MDHSPPHLFKLGVLLAVTFHITVQLVPPPVTVVFGKNTVVRAGMPETSINENRDTCSGKYDVRATRKFSQVYAESKTATMQFLAYQYLGSSGRPRHPLHLSRHCGSQGNGSP
jgi:hypothetical protein